MEHQLPALPYAKNALAPHISEETLEFHYGKHHQTYVTNLNTAFGKLVEAEAKKDISSIVALQQVIKFNGGGHLNHSIFWQNLIPASKGGGHLADGELKNAITAQYGNLEGLKNAISTVSVGVQGSGWGWLGFDKTNNRLVVTSTANQDPLQATTGLIPLLGIDVWEHAYYLQYKNVRPDYLKNIFSVINWEDVAKRYAEAKK